MKLCDRCRVAGCLLNYGGKACKNARKQNCPDVVFTNADRVREMNDEELAKFMLSNDGAAYYATEIDKYAIQTTQHNFPDTVQLGDAFQVRDEEWRPRRAEEAE